MAYSRGKSTVGALLLTGALSAFSATPISLQGQAFGSIDRVIPDSAVSEYCDAFLARITPRGIRDTDSTKGNTQNMYLSDFMRYNPVLDTFDTLNIYGRATEDTNYRFFIKNFVARKVYPATNWVPTVFFDCPYPPYDTVVAFGLSINAVDTTRLAGKGLVGRTLGFASLLRVPNRVCTTEVFTNGRSSRYLSYANAMWNLEKILVNVNDFDTTKLRVIAIFSDSEYYSETLIPLKPSVYGQAQAVESLSLYQYVQQHVGVKEEEKTVESNKSERMWDRIMSNPELAKFIREEEAKGNKVQSYDASGRKKPYGGPGVNFLEITGRGRNTGKNVRRFKVVCPSDGRFRNVPMH